MSNFKDFDSRKRSIEESLQLEESDSDNSEVDDESDAGDIPRTLFDYGYSLVKNDGSNLKAMGAFGKAVAILVDMDEALMELDEKIRKRAGKGDGKVPPGSNLVQRTLRDDRYFIAICKLFMAKISLAQCIECTESANFNELHFNAVQLIQESLLWFPKCVGSLVTLFQIRRIHFRESNTKLAPSWVNNITVADVITPLQRAINIEIPSLEVDAEMDFIDVLDEELRNSEVCNSKLAKEQLSLFYLQWISSGGEQSECIPKNCSAVADRLLLQCGYRYKLANSVLNYAFTSQKADKTAPPFIHCIDNVLSHTVLERIQHIFRWNSPYWREHEYDACFGNYSKRAARYCANDDTCNKRSGGGYFSYLYPLKTKKASNCMEQIIDVLFGKLCKQFPCLESDCTVAEWWVHSRPHCSGHQMHFDSDETNTANGNKPQHPIATCVLYCSGLENLDFGGPTLITNQVLVDGKSPHSASKSDATSFATCGWMCLPKPNRLISFDAKYLHGVIPGARSIHAEYPDAYRRLTFMVGFWKSICAVDRGVDNPGPGQPFPDSAKTQYTWCGEMYPFPDDHLEGSSSACDLALSNDVVEISPVWVPLSPDSILTQPTYDNCFQGF